MKVIGGRVRASQRQHTCRQSQQACVNSVCVVAGGGDVGDAEYDDLPSNAACTLDSRRRTSYIVSSFYQVRCV